MTRSKSTLSSQAVLCIWAGSIYSCELVQLDEVQCNLKATLLVVDAYTVWLVRTKIRLQVLTAQELYVPVENTIGLRSLHIVQKKKPTLIFSTWEILL